MLSVVAHELTETASDPLIQTWYNERGFENADMCAWQFGTTLTSTSGKVYNVKDVNGRLYYLQMNLNPMTGKCVTGV